ncbi:unnamed protein product [Ambrosiozyma monospora]|uniref:Unnamed protein product n=1 Tax=Ambrosiozyma monospora TaxID=43982 RepID=A0ACB5U5R4_AMBMO|nr:unnamed protein product [Ambrosiozyma monospora]
MTISNSISRETGIELASSLLPEIQTNFLKFVVQDFLCFIHDRHYIIEDFDITITCSWDIQAHLLSLTGYDDLLDDIICMAIEELGLTLIFKEIGRDGPFIEEFIKFVTSSSVQLKVCFL